MSVDVQRAMMLARQLQHHPLARELPDEWPEPKEYDDHGPREALVSLLLEFSLRGIALPAHFPTELEALVVEARQMATRYGRASVIYRLAMTALPGEDGAPEIELEEGVE